MPKLDPHEWIPVPGKANEFYFQSSGAKAPDTNTIYQYIGSGVWLKKGTYDAYVVGKYAPKKGQLAHYWTYTQHNPPPPPVPYKPAKPFDMKGRARTNEPGTKVYYDKGRPSIGDIIAKETNVIGVPLSPSKLDKQQPSPGKLITRERKGAYMISEPPLSPQPPRPPAKSKPKTSALPPCPGDIKVTSHKIYKNTIPGSTSPTRASAMGGWSADKYAAAVEVEFKDAKWEWLHPVGHSLGGHNRQMNLVAGTFDCNTQMIPLEKEVLGEKAKLKIGESISYDVTAKLLPGTHVATKITVKVKFPPRLAREDIVAMFYPTDNTKISKIQYAMANHDFRRLSGGIHTDVGLLSPSKSSAPNFSSPSPQKPKRLLESVFIVGRASGVGNNCLLDSLNQLKTGSWHTDKKKIDDMRETLKATVPNVGTANMLDIYGQEGRQLLNDLNMRVRIVERRLTGIITHPVQGPLGATLYYLLHQGLHFSPLMLRSGFNDTHVDQLR